MTSRILAESANKMYDIKNAAKSLYDSDVFFFSSRRRHTRLQGDWSSDVCSSDLSESYLDFRGRGYGGTVGAGLAGEAQHAFADDVLLDLGRTGEDRARARAEEVVRDRKSVV